MGLSAVAALIYVYFRVVRPLRQLREAMRRLAEGDFRPVLLDSRLGVFRETAGHVRRISELLQQFDQQVVNEGFNLRAILSSMVEGVLITDASQHIRLVNEPLHQMFDIRQSPVDRTVMEVFRSHELQQAIEMSLRDGSPRQIEILRSAPGGAHRHFEAYASALNPQGGKNPLGAVVVFHDVSTIKKLESVRREFVANVSHEFRTPLSIINGYIETLMDGALDDRPMAERSLAVMQKNGQRLALLIEDLLSLSRLEHRYSQLELQEFNLRDALTRVRERIEPEIVENKAKVAVDWAKDAEFIEADPRRVEEVYSNLLENAVRYGNDGSGRGASVQVTGRRVGEHVEITFADDGPGIPLEDQPHIFERFYRVHKDRSRVAGGTGLGLSIVKHIVQAHGGNVSVESSPGKGAAFIVLLPVSQSAGTLKNNP